MAGNLSDLLRQLVEMKGSDLHLTPHSPPVVRVDGDLQPLEGAALSPAETRELIYGVLTDVQKKRLEETLEIDFSFGIRGLCRFRGNVFHQRGALGGVFRMIPFEIPDFPTLHLPPIVAQLCQRPRGLILVTGPTGSGKSTTLAAMIDLLNRTTKQHILTVEDPIEFLHSHKQSIVNQREVSADTRSFGDALRVALRQDPDVVLIGEMRDLETVEAALRIAETGHLTLATLHTNSAAATIHRIVDVFPSHQQDQVRAQLSLVLEGVMCQSLLPRIGGGRCMAMEVLVPNSAVRNLIREDKVHQIYSAMQSGQDRSGMQTFNQSLAGLVRGRSLLASDALSASSAPDELQSLLNRMPAGAPEPRLVATR